MHLTFSSRRGSDLITLERSFFLLFINKFLWREIQSLKTENNKGKRAEDKNLRMRRNEWKLKDGVNMTWNRIVIMET